MRIKWFVILGCAVYTLGCGNKPTEPRQPTLASVDTVYVWVVDPTVIDTVYVWTTDTVVVFSEKPLFPSGANQAAIHFVAKQVFPQWAWCCPRDNHVLIEGCHFDAEGDAIVQFRCGAWSKWDSYECEEGTIVRCAISGSIELRWFGLDAPGTYEGWKPTNM